MNNGVWHQIENLARKLAVRYDSVMIVCGPVFTSSQPQTFGIHAMPVPDAFFKAFMVYSNEGYHTVAFLCPNNAEPITVTAAMRSVNTVEALTELNLFSSLDNRIEEHVESIVDTSVWVP